jgi:hypothetical protein
MVLAFVRLQGESLPARRDAFRDLTRIAQRDTEIGMRLGQPRIERDHPTVTFDRRVELAFFLQAEGEAELCLWGRRV